MFFSIIIVCLNSGRKLKDTAASIAAQTETDYEVIIKDGLSEDGSVEAFLETADKGFLKAVRIERRRDSGIYDAMNQAASMARGEYLLFLNCGDLLYDSAVLETVKKAAGNGKKGIYYGDICERRTGSFVASNPRLDAFGCYRNVPCHQACFYHRELFEGRGYLLQYRVRADYEHFLWCFFQKKAAAVYLPVTVASYEGGGFSETAKNRRISKEEHKEITKRYMTAAERFRFRATLWLTLAPLRGKMAQSPLFSGFYNRFKSLCYRREK